MLKNAVILLLLAAIVALPFALRRTDAGTAWRAGDPMLVVVTPHNEAIRYEFEHGFSKWHRQKYGTPVKIEWRAIGGTTEIMRYLSSEYASSAKSWWERALKRKWPTDATEKVTGGSPPSDPAVLEVYDAFRATDDPDVLSSRIDLFFGGGEFDHSTAFKQGLTVIPWKPGAEPKGLFYLSKPGQSAGSASAQSAVPDIALIPEKVSGEVWRTPSVFGNAISTFGICYNFDRLRELGVATPPSVWDDLANPVYFGQVGACDPSKSASVAKAFEMMIHQKVYQAVRAAGFADAQIAAFEKGINDYQKKQGLAYQRGDLPPSVPATYQSAVERGWLDGVHLVLRIGANARYFTDSSSKVPIDVSMGDAAVGMSIDFYGRYQAQTSKGPRGEDRMVYLTPLGGSSVSADPISLLRGAGGGADTPQARRERREVAIRFIEFVLSEEGQKLWTYRPGTPGGPEKFTLRRLPVRRDFYPSTNPTLNARHLEHLKYAADNLADPQVDPYQVGEQFTYYPRWTGQHFAFHRDLIRVMCVDAGDELKAAWRAIIDHGGPAEQPHAMKALERLPEEIAWRTAPEIIKKQKKIDYTRNWTIFFRNTYAEARKLIR